MQKLPKSLTTITPTSRRLALILFLFVPIIAFYLGMQYQQALTLTHDEAVIESQK